MPRFSGQFCKKWMREGGSFFSEVFFLFSKNLSNNLNEMYLPKAATAWATLHDITTGSFSTLDLPIVAETEHLSYFSGKVQPSGADCPFFMELYNSVNVHDVEKSKIMLHGIKTLLEWAIWQEILPCFCWSTLNNSLFEIQFSYFHLSIKRAYDSIDYFLSIKSVSDWTPKNFGFLQ